MPKWQKPLRGVALNRASPLARSLMYAWTFNEGSGGIARDMVAGLVGTFDGSATPTWTPTMHGVTLHCDTAGDHVDLPVDLLNGVTSWTIATRMKSLGGTNNMWCGAVADTINYIYCYNAVRNRYANSAGNTATWTGDTNFLNVWRSVAMTADGTNAELWLDGISQGTQAPTGGTTLLLNTIGAGYSTAANNLLGYLEYFYVWHRTLAASEIRQVHLAPFSVCAHHDLSWLYVAAAGAPGYYYRYLTRLWGEA